MGTLARALGWGRSCSEAVHHCGCSTWQTEQVGYAVSG